MPSVNTMRGPVDVNDLGFVLSHEHVRESSAGVPQTYPELFDHEEDVARGISRLNEAAAEGVNTVLIVTPLDLGRDMRLLQDVAAGVNLHMVCATGMWRDIPRHVGLGATVERLAAAFIREIEVGIDGTGVKAGVIKVATDLEHMTEDGGLTRPNELILRSAARACIATGIPITTHTAAPARAGDRQIAIFEDEGVDLHRVTIGHSNDSDNIEYLTGIMKKGAFLGMDRYPGGRGGGLDWEQRTQVVKELVDLGFASQVTLSHDYGGARPALPEAAAARPSHNPDGYCFIIRKVLPRLRELGVSEDAITEMTVNAPRRFMGGE